MYGEVAGLSEGSGAVCTLERSLSIMDSHVNLQSRGSQEHLLADFTGHFLALFPFSLVGCQWHCMHHGWHTADVREHPGIVIEVIRPQQRWNPRCATERWMHIAVGKLTISCNWGFWVYLGRAHPGARKKKRCFRTGSSKPEIVNRKWENGSKSASGY